MNPRPMEPSSVGQVFARFSSDGVVTGCAEVKADPTFVALRCDWANFAPGAEGHVIVDMVFLPAKTPFFRFDQTLGWRVQIPQDDLTARVLRETDDRNNRRVDVKHVFCGDLDRAPECVSAP